MTSDHPPVCDYDGSDYQTTFWDQSDRQYEDLVEAIALKRLLPPGGKILLELGAGAGRNTSRYHQFDRIVLLDYSITQLKLAQERLGKSNRYLYVAGDVYRLPFSPGSFEAATMIRTFHHMADPQRALMEIRNVIQPGGVFILEYANKRNLKAIARFLLRKQSWNPFSPEPVEFATLNFDFHPKTVERWLQSNGFIIKKRLTVSHFRLALLKRLFPLKVLVGLDSLAQWTGNWWQLTPSVFVLAIPEGEPSPVNSSGIFHCPECRRSHLEERQDIVLCPVCQCTWAIHDGIYNFRAAF
ncbi:MAG: class I SAM-dependent methyltransferase [Anaerolineales bacterium]